MKLIWTDQCVDDLGGKVMLRTDKSRSLASGLEIDESKTVRTGPAKGEWSQNDFSVLFNEALQLKERDSPVGDLLLTLRIIPPRELV